MTKREQIQSECINIMLQYKRASAAVSMGVGKTLIGLNYINHLQGKNMGKLRVLVVAPKLSIFDSWKNDANKFKIDIDNIEFTTYLSLNKKDCMDYDIVILDECHSLLYSHQDFLVQFEGRVLGLTGTPPRYLQSEKGQMVSMFCPIKFSYITDDAVEDNILNDYKIVIHKMYLSNKNDIVVKLKDKEFYTSEVRNYGYWCDRVDAAVGPKQSQITAIMRMKALMGFKTKENYAKKLLNEIDEKCIVFANTQKQADNICEHSVHSKNPDSDYNLQEFKEGIIDKLSCVMQLNEGVNIPELRAGIIMHSYGNERKTLQRFGRMLRLNPNETATIHILCYKDTIDEKWVEEALKDLDQSKITYVNN